MTHVRAPRQLLALFCATRHRPLTALGRRRQPPKAEAKNGIEKTHAPQQRTMGEAARLRHNRQQRHAKYSSNIKTQRRKNTTAGVRACARACATYARRRRSRVVAVHGLAGALGQHHCGALLVKVHLACCKRARRGRLCTGRGARGDSGERQRQADGAHGAITTKAN